MSVFPVYDSKYCFVLNNEPIFPEPSEVEQYSVKNTVNLCEWDRYFFKFYNPNIPDEFNKLPASWEWLGYSSGIFTLRFKNASGRTRLGGLSLFIANRKLDETRYQALLNYLGDQYADLLFSFGSGVGFTHQRNGTGGRHLAYAEWLFLRGLLKQEHDLNASLNAIFANPHRRLHRESYAVSPDQVRRINPQALIAGLSAAGVLAALPLNHPLAATPLGRFLKINGQAFFPQTIQEERIETSYDTPENRFVKYFLEDLQNRLKYIADTFAQGKSSYLHPELCEEVARLRLVVCSGLEHPLWREVGRLRMVPSGSMVLQRQEGYRQLFHFYALLQLLGRYDYALPALEDLLELKDTATLYEYWCFFQVKQVLDNFLHLRQITSLVKEDGGLSQSLQEALCLHYDGNITLCFSRRFSGSKGSDQPLLPNSYHVNESYSFDFYPDIAIGFAGRWLLLDAKNKGENGFYGEEENGVISKFKDEDIYKMHTYRDALTEAVGAFILYPGNESAFYPVQTDGSFFSGVGALPLRPGSDGVSSVDDRKRLEVLLRGFLSTQNLQIGKENSYKIVPVADSTGSHPLPTTPLSEWDMILADAFGDEVALINRLIGLNLPLPQCGFELNNEQCEIIAEAFLAWPELKIVIIFDEFEDDSATFTQAGWNVFLNSELDKDIQSLLSAFV